MADTPTKPTAKETAKERNDAAEAKPIVTKDKPVEQSPDAEKVTVKTSGAFMLVDPFSGAEFTKDEATKTAKTPFVAERLESGDLVEA